MEIDSTTMGRDEFLMLFVAQLQHQDPLSPMDSAAFTAELAQFSQIEQMYNMNSTLEAILDNQTSMNNGASANLIGREIKWMEEDAEQSGTVVGVNFEDGVAYLMTDNDNRVALGDVTEIRAI